MYRNVAGIYYSVVCDQKARSEAAPSSVYGELFAVQYRRPCSPVTRGAGIMFSLKKESESWMKRCDRTSGPGCGGHNYLHVPSSTKGVITNKAEAELSACSSNIILLLASRCWSVVSHIQSRASSERGGRAEPCCLFSVIAAAFFFFFFFCVARQDFFQVVAGTNRSEIDRIRLLDAALREETS